MVTRKTIKKARTMQTEINGTFHWIKNPSLNFRKFALTDGTAFCKIHEHKDNLARCTCIQILGNFLPGICFVKLNFGLNGSLSRFRIFSDLLENVHTKFPYHLSPFLNLRI